MKKSTEILGFTWYRAGNWILLSMFVSMAILVPARSSGQFENVWVYKGCSMDFNQAGPDPVLAPSNLDGKGEGCASVCDEQGQLLFYTNGYKVWDRDGNLMPNGAALISDPALPSLSDIGADDYISSSSQGALIVPMPGQPGRYYIFSMTSIEVTYTHRLYYSIVDMNLNGGSGDVDPAAKGLLFGTGYTEHMTGVVGDRCNVWLLVTSRVENKLFAYNIHEGGIDMEPVVSSLLTVNDYAKIGFIDVSPDRKQLALGKGGFGLYDFDPATGIATGKVALLAAPNAYALAYNVCFSPNNSKLYVTFVGLLSIILSAYQFDLDAPDSLAIVNSRVELPAVTRYKRAPDGKVYSTQGWVIQYPDLPAPACQIEESNLPGSCSGGFPGFSNVVPVIPRDTFYTQQSLSAGCFASQTLVTALDDTTGWGYIWSTGDAGASLEVSEPGIYWVSYHTPPCTFHTDTFEVGFPNGVLPTIQVDTACAGTTNGGAYAVTYPGDTVTYRYTWLNGSDTLSLTDTLTAVTGGNYTLLIHTAHCDTSLNFIIPEVDYRVGFTMSDTLLCMGDTLWLQNTSDMHFSQFAWYFGDGDSSLSPLPVGHVYSHDGGYEILVAGSGHICSDTARDFVLVDPRLAISFLMDQQELCAGDGVYFQLEDADTTFTGLHWDWGDGSYLQAPYTTIFYHAFDSVGQLPVKVTLNSRACPDTSFADTVRVYALPEVNLGGDTSLCLDGHAVVLRNLASAPDEPYHYLWSSGDTTASLRVLQPGSYSLRVTKEPLGCNTTDAIEVRKDCYTDIPNAFTPNGDGDNDYFFPRTQLSQSVSDFKMQVFNRWGQLVFETTSIDGRGWDGRLNEQEQPLGVYIYLVDVAYSNGRQEQYKGNVTLVR